MEDISQQKSSVLLRNLFLAKLKCRHCNRAMLIIHTLQAGLNNEASTSALKMGLFFKRPFGVINVYLHLPDCLCLRALMFACLLYSEAAVEPRG